MSRATGFQDLPLDMQDKIFCELVDYYGDFYGYDMESKTLRIGIERFLRSYEREESLQMLGHLYKTGLGVHKIVIHCMDTIFATNYRTGQYGSTIFCASENDVYEAKRLLQVIMEPNISCTFVMDTYQSFEDLLSDYLVK